MSRGKKKRKRPGWQERRRRQEQAEERREEQLFDDVAQDTAARFTCSTEIAEDFAGQCASRLDDLETDLAFNRVAQEIWSGRPGRAEELAQALAALCAERDRERAALTALRERFEALAADQTFHEHLDPVEEWQGLVRRKLFPDAPAG